MRFSRIYVLAAAMASPMMFAQECAPAVGGDAQQEQAAAAYPLHEAAARGDVDACRRILWKEVYDMNVDRQDAEGRTALHMAAAHDQEAVCTLLLRYGANAFAHDAKGRTPVMLAAENGAVKACVPLLLMGALDDSDRLLSCKSPVQIALEHEHAQTLYLLLTSISPKFLEHIEKLAAPGKLVTELKPYRDALQRARNAENSSSSGSNWGKLALHYWECINGRRGFAELPCIPLLAELNPGALSVETLRGMVRAGADMEATLPTGSSPQTALEMAVKRADVQLCAALLEAGANPNRRDKFGRTPLHELPFREESAELARLLIQAGADPNAEDDDHITPFRRNLQMGDIYLNIRRELAAGPIKVRGEEPLALAAALNDTETCERLIQEGADVNAVSRQGGKTPLQWAAILGNVELIHKLLAAGANPYTKGHTVLCAAAGANQVASCAALLDAGVSPICEQYGWTEPVLHQAARMGAHQVCKLLLERGMDPNALDRGARTALMIAADHGQHRERICEQLLAAGARADLAAKDGTTALHNAAGCVFWYSDTLVRKLLAAGADVNATNQWYDTPLHLAVRIGSVQACRTLLEAGAEPSLSIRSVAKVTGDGHIMRDSRDLPKRLEIGVTPLEFARALAKDRSYQRGDSKCDRQGVLSLLEEYAAKVESKAAEAEATEPQE